MSQLERLRLREVNKIKSKIIKAKKLSARKILTLEKQRHMMEAQISALNDSLPRIQEEFQLQENDLRAMVVEIDGLKVSCHKDEEALQSFKAAMRENPFSESNARKRQLLDELIQAQQAETQELEQARAQKHQEVQSVYQRLQSEIELTHEKVRSLEADIQTSIRLKSETSASLVTELEELGSDLERAERKSMLNNVSGAGASPEREEHWFGCPVCLVLLKPPMRIFQCPEGHILCEECKENPSMVHCPQCRCPLEGVCSRNRALEEVARSFFPMAPSETL